MSINYLLCRIPPLAGIMSSAINVGTHISTCSIKMCKDYEMLIILKTRKFFVLEKSFRTQSKSSTTIYRKPVIYILSMTCMNRTLV